LTFWAWDRAVQHKFPQVIRDHDLSETSGDGRTRFRGLFVLVRMSFGLVR
jgi:hypothetical protein